MIIKKIEERMNLSLGSYSKELSTVRTGRANPKMLDGVRVEVYGQKMPISQLATVSIPEPQMINVQVWDKANVGAVDQAIRTSDLNLNPLVDGQLLRIAIPKLTEERRKELIKVLKTIAEKAKVAIRNIRRDSLEELKKEQKDKNLSEDDLKKNSNEVQKITDLKIAEIDKKLSEKEVEILKV
ncbi:MAG: ribosome recycling factor [Proteobacteria bacterium]|jgi:ribosome recycling factor|uniref:Ribosome-recycling factor n=2 Tax=Candidatus Fonsibacter lacus TaxID=2576439 RepID=A0A966M160_9PROT|nr:ribosome recycling factor [Candidatus Fonsibacter lacus]NDB49152.1 ribosome recycling factor [Pseudomonadota bacterium]NBV39963.1 ribosome recycling factor [Candidatus Fonsibacter lacus]NBY89440.1 ribosome recycling factor [Candidatus Fonsibacter lacus]NCU47339.1 ribosome recycling factor [Candidatus Fonsibacter lacus]